MTHALTGSTRRPLSDGYLASPHLDSWLNHVTRIKLPYGELTVAASSTHRTINSDALLYLADALSLTELSTYKDKLDQDIEYIEAFEIPEMELEHEIRKKLLNGDQDTSDSEDKLNKLRDVLTKAQRLRPVFNHVISPIAKCLKKALDKGMSVERIRRELRPAAEDLEEIILAGDRLSKDELEIRHNDFWTRVKQLPQYVHNYLDDWKAKDAKAYDGTPDEHKECLSYLGRDDIPMPVDYKSRVENSDLPRMADYKNVSYLGVAAFFFSAFVKDEELAQKIFDKISADLQHKDKEFLYFKSYIGYYKGWPTEAVISYLQELLNDAREHKIVLERADKQCTQHPCEPDRSQLIQKLLKREQEAELRAVNDLAYYIGDSIARGIPSALNYRGQAEDYVDELYRSMDKESDPENRNEFLDTYAYVSIVLESRKTEPEPDKFRSMRATLEKVAEYFETTTLNTTNLEDATARANLGLVRAHLAAARELAEE
jgi:hypothetical protein